MRIVTVLSLVALFLLPTKLFAAAPAYLLNKTITVSSTTTTPFIENGRSGTGSRVTVHTIYVSNAGRIFLRRARRDRNASSTEEFAYDTGLSMRFDGNKLVGTALYSSGAGRMIVSFDPAGQSCTATMQFGRDNGRPFAWKGVNGHTYTATGPSVASNITCSITAGNAFAGQ